MASVRASRTCVACLLTFLVLLLLSGCGDDTAAPTLELVVESRVTRAHGGVEAQVKVYLRSASKEEIQDRTVALSATLETGDPIGGFTSELTNPAELQLNADGYLSTSYYCEQDGIATITASTEGLDEVSGSLTCVEYSNPYLAISEFVAEHSQLEVGETTGLFACIERIGSPIQPAAGIGILLEVLDGEGGVGPSTLDSQTIETGEDNCVESIFNAGSTPGEVRLRATFANASVSEHYRELQIVVVE